MTKRKQTIIEWLSCDDIDTVARRYFEHGQYNINGISMAVYGLQSLEITPSQLRSLYTTLAGMVKDKLLVCSSQIVSGINAKHRDTLWHVAHRLDRDDLMMLEINGADQERLAKVKLNFFGLREQ